MIIKVVGMIVVLFSSTLLGFGFAECMASRARELKNISDALELMQGELTYGHFAVGDIFFRICSEVKGACVEMFEEICKNLEMGESASESWIKALDIHAVGMSLKPEDVTALKNSAYFFEAKELEEQRKYLSSLKARVDLLYDEAIRDKHKNSRIVKMLGIYGGILICIIIF